MAKNSIKKYQLVSICSARQFSVQRTSILTLIFHGFHQCLKALCWDITLTSYNKTKEMN